MNDEVAVLLATYNGRRYLGEQVTSILNQTHRYIHLVIVDDCSTDGTFEVLEGIAEGDTRITLLRNSTNLGVVGTFERLLGFVESPFFCFEPLIANCERENYTIPFMPR